MRFYIDVSSDLAGWRAVSTRGLWWPHRRTCGFRKLLYACNRE